MKFNSILSGLFSVINKGIQRTAWMMEPNFTDSISFSVLQLPRIRVTASTEKYIQ
jgi:hypothetical protein